nr:immunoglobulin heavy chain junction region [Macaca mulatta]MPN69636.1 immunoglobulin heavy chain junction region [Macaca mulatta]MPN70034.1 immunoglobulin heavy chain junction region [Macaca mulatta]MPN70412.1 immunoglobulin heavy chain junction region [Macaca mulatta]MPN70620.1 immunoglobulin heavy chain junction region [Macaca mulatta]
CAREEGTAYSYGLDSW